MAFTRPIASLLVEGLLRVVLALPASARRSLVAAAAWAAYRIGIRRQVALDNLRQAFPELSEGERRRIAKGAYQNMALSYLEGLVGPRLSTDELDRAVVVDDNWAPVEAALSAGKGVLMATAHFGSWELLGEVLSRRGIKLNAVTRSLRGAFNARLVESRQSSGMRFISTRGAILASVKALRRGEMVAMLVDQVLPASSGVFVPFFGRPACTTPALSMAAIRAQAPVFVALAAREDDHLRMFVEGPLPIPQTGNVRRDIVEHTAAVTQVLERYIRKYPDQWLWLHRRWKVQPIKS
jgi:KDO2-lipid IV(A) lauroyltransferase